MQQCEGYCLADPNCCTWTYCTPEAGAGDPERCCLKNGVPPLLNNSGTVTHWTGAAPRATSGQCSAGPPYPGPAYLVPRITNSPGCLHQGVSCRGGAGGAVAALLSPPAPGAISPSDRPLSPPRRRLARYRRRHVPARYRRISRVSRVPGLQPQRLASRHIQRPCPLGQPGCGRHLRTARAVRHIVAVLWVCGGGRQRWHGVRRLSPVQRQLAQPHHPTGAAGAALRQ